MMNNRDYSRSDLAAAHVRHGEKLRSNLERAQGSSTGGRPFCSARRRAPYTTPHGLDSCSNSLLSKMRKKHYGRTVFSLKGKRTNADRPPKRALPPRPLPLAHLSHVQHHAPDEAHLDAALPAVRHRPGQGLTTS